MVSPELLRRYPFFAGLRMDQIVTLAKLADEMWVQPGYYFFHEGEELHHFYLITEGQVDLSISLLEIGSRAVVPDLVEMSREVPVCTMVPGEVFAWSALVPPHHAVSNACALTECQVVAFDCVELRKQFENDYQFGFLMMEKAAQVIRDRLRAMYHEALAYVAR
jgi:CRP-like cAMP-binding protein